jgi:hypothetical protein
MRNLRSISLFAVALVATAAAADSAKHPGLVVSATVVPYLRWSVIGQPATIEVTGEDLRRGAIEVQGIAANIRTNDPAGYVIVFRLDDTVFKEAEITGLPQRVVLGPGGSFVHNRENLTRQPLSLQLRLRDDAQPGRYRWPLRIEVSRIQGR